jgi:hypothetical protein
MKKQLLIIAMIFSYGSIHTMPIDQEINSYFLLITAACQNNSSLACTCWNKHNEKADFHQKECQKIASLESWPNRCMDPQNHFAEEINLAKQNYPNHNKPYTALLTPEEDAELTSAIESLCIIFKITQDKQDALKQAFNKEVIWLE